MCGIIGVIAEHVVSQDIYDALTIIQHRGQDAAGMMTSDQARLYLRKANGYVRDALQKRHMLQLKGNMGLGHVRYPTAGAESSAESQPFYVNSPYGLCLVHNGNLVNAPALAEELQHTDLRHLNTSSDSEVLLNIFAYELQRVGGIKLTTEALFAAVNAVYSRVVGAYSAIVLINGYGLLAFRDPHGIRPLVYGKRTYNGHTDYMIASETIALDVLGYERIADVQPGEAVFIDLHGKIQTHQSVSNAKRTPCIFEYIYLARPDSVIDGISVYRARRQMGIRLANKIKQQKPEHDIDVVIPIPDTSRTSALSLAQTLQVPYSEGFVKNRYIGRTFIMPGQEQRRNSVRMKLNAMRQEFEGKTVLLVDDSIVRGTTSKEIIQMARDAGASKVYFASAAPEVRYPNVYGIDMPNANELVAHQRDCAQIEKLLGADWLIYQDLADVYSAINDAALNAADRVDQFEDSIFTGQYITGGVDEAYLNYIANLRSDSKKHKKRLSLEDESSVNEL